MPKQNFIDWLFYGRENVPFFTRNFKIFTGIFALAILLRALTMNPFDGSVLVGMMSLIAAVGFTVLMAALFKLVFLIPWRTVLYVKTMLQN